MPMTIPYFRKRPLPGPARAGTFLMAVLAAAGMTGWAPHAEGDEVDLQENELEIPRATESAPPPETIIEGDQLEMIATEDEAYFIFTDNIRVIGNNIILTCDRLEVISTRDEDDPPGAERLSGMGRIRLIVASGNVRVVQEGREATAGRAEVLPNEGRVILTESPVIRDAQGEVSGERMVLYQGLERAVVESGPDRPARVVLPNIPDLGFRPGESGESNE